MTGSTVLVAVVAAGLSGFAVLLWLPPPTWLVALRLGPATSPPHQGEGPPSAAARPLLLRVVAWRRWRSWVPVALAAAAAPWFVTSPVSALLLATVAAVAVVASSFVERHRAARAASELTVRVAATVELLAAELRTGVLPPVALRGACDDLPDLRPVAEVAARGGDVPAALDGVSRLPGAGDLADVAAAWRVAERAGAPVADVLDHVVEALRADHDLAREVRAECSSARATARLLAVLPLLGLGLGSGLGGDPVHVLTGTLPGVVCLAAGCALAATGLAWVERITTRAEVGAR
ncbi:MULTISPECIES: type II secretion system protein [unclassified Aeromicrobium]|uniref:type II secretion system F family protein n=1 Tax=unclassified Aeromicrobium TaxID=2633570 RepID=UPI0028896374|nr:MULTISPECIES: type II secretion system protein [unclassified Aeromicrobium]